MRIAFVSSLYECLGIEYLSAYLKKMGHDVFLFFDPRLFSNYLINIKLIDRMFSLKDYLINQVIKIKPDIIAFSVLSDNYTWCCDIARDIKNRLDTQIIFGGIHATSVPQEVLKNDFVDFVICGEGEEALVEFVDRMSRGKDIFSTANLGYRKSSKIILNKLRPPLENLDAVLFPDKDLFYNEYNDFVREAYMIITSRGCAYKCSYCCENFMDRLYGKYYRRRSPDNVIDELVMAKEKYAIKRVNFQDSVFINNREWLQDFLPKYKEKIGLPFFCFMYPSRMIDEKLLSSLVDAGCTTVNMGVQSLNSTLRREIFLRYESNEDVEFSIAAIKKFKIYLYLDFILFPLQEEADLLEMLRFCGRVKPDFVAIDWLTYYPGTEIIGISQELSLLSDHDVEAILQGRDYRPYAGRNAPIIAAYSKIANLIYISGILSPKLIDFIIRFKIHRFLPSRNLFLPFIIIVGLIKQKFEKKTPFSYQSALSYFGKYYMTYIRRRMAKHRASI